MTFKIHHLTQTNGLDDFRFIAKKMASLLTMKSRLSWGNFPMRRVTNEVLEGTVKLSDLQDWYPKAVSILNKAK